MSHHTFYNAQIISNMNTFHQFKCFVYTFQTIDFVRLLKWPLSLIMQLTLRLFKQQGFSFRNTAGKLERASHWSQTSSGRNEHRRFTRLFPCWLGKRWVWHLHNELRITKILIKIRLYRIGNCRIVGLSLGCWSETKLKKPSCFQRYELMLWKSMPMYTRYTPTKNFGDNPPDIYRNTLCVY